MEEETLALIYSKLISPQFVGDGTVRSMRTFVIPSILSSSCQQEFRKVYYVPVEQRRFQDIRIEFLTTEGLYIPFEDSTTHTKVVLQYGKITSGKNKVYKTGRRNLE